jgi:hypothetical protein
MVLLPILLMSIRLSNVQSVVKRVISAQTAPSLRAGKRLSVITVASLGISDQTAQTCLKIIISRRSLHLLLPLVRLQEAPQ